ncbi:hypothetical protein HanXRQr2_Chr09g0388591 [Helianthus annuus]|uniref:Uncharacterized protein n=1 Tax=Helianthus annuus TaxID=4232 RepID=A0A251TX32_HELAN|nr:hypothetical protein HanXRQr2_Chr09g0388591 [Helianthus annuus]
MRYNHMHNKGAKGCVISDNGSVCDAITPICIFWCGTVTYEVFAKCKERQKPYEELKHCTVFLKRLTLCFMVL